MGARLNIIKVIYTCANEALCQGYSPVSMTTRTTPHENTSEGSALYGFLAETSGEAYCAVV